MGMYRAVISLPSPLKFDQYQTIEAESMSVNGLGSIEDVCYIKISTSFTGYWLVYVHVGLSNFTCVPQTHDTCSDTQCTLLFTQSCQHFSTKKPILFLQVTQS